MQKIAVYGNICCIRGKILPIIHNFISLNYLGKNMALTKEQIEGIVETLSPIMLMLVKEWEKLQDKETR